MTTDIPTEIRTAAESLRDANTPHENQLTWWLIDTALQHTPLDGRCERDGDDWPCDDIAAAHKVAELVPAPARQS